MDYTSKIKHVALYARKSRLSDNSDEAKTLESQMRIMEDFIKSKGWTYEIYAEVISGGDTDRSEFERMLGHIKSCLFDGVATIDVDRIARNSLDFARFKEACIKTGTYIITPSGITNPAIAEDNLSATILAAVSEFELQQFKKRVKRAKIQKATEGKWTIGLAPIGYIRNAETGKLIIDKKSAQIVRIAFQLSSEGKSLKDIMVALNGLGYVTQRKKPFTPTTVLHLITNPVYIGKIIYNPGIKSKNKIHDQIPSIEVKKAHESIIDDETWTRVQKGLKDRRTKPVRSRHFTHALSGLVFCGCCGNSMNVFRNKSGNIYIRNCKKLYTDGSHCSNSGCRQDELLSAIIEHIRDEYNKLQNVTNQLISLAEQRQSLTNEIKIVEINIEKHNIALNKINELYEDSIYTREEYIKRRTSRLNQLDLEKKRLEELKASFENFDDSKPQEQLQRFNDFLNNFEEYYSKYEQDDGEEAAKNLNLLIQSVISKILVTRESKPKGSNQRYDPNPIHLHIIYK